MGPPAIISGAYLQELALPASAMSMQTLLVVLYVKLPHLAMTNEGQLNGKQHVIMIIIVTVIIIVNLPHRGAGGLNLLHS